jgi:hypothetical protein
MTSSRLPRSREQNNDTSRPSVVAGTRNADIIAEDGWIFVERPGERVKCVRRYIPQEDSELSQPNLARHYYPSN